MGLKDMGDDTNERATNLIYSFKNYVNITSRALPCRVGYAPNKVYAKVLEQLPLQKVSRSTFRIT